MKIHTTESRTCKITMNKVNFIIGWQRNQMLIWANEINLYMYIHVEYRHSCKGIKPTYEYVSN